MLAAWHFLLTGWRRRLVSAALALATGWVALPSQAAVPELQDQALLDELVGRYVGADAAPGAAAVLVHRDGRVTLKGYGVASLEGGAAVDPERTVFRIGSISKSFTALAILQLLDEGKIALDADANRYLKGVQIPGRGGPVRVLDLLTHRGGFDGNLTHVGLDERGAAAQSSDARLQRDIFRVRPAGLLPSYDNLAWGLLGHIVESVDGMPYAQAMQRRIFAPLGMRHTQVGLPADAAAPLALPYEVGNDGRAHLKPAIFLRRGWQGAGDISTTAGDMSRFLSALLAEGAYPGGRLLKPETFRRMSDTRGFGFHPGLRSIGLGAYALGQTGGGGFGHGGTIRGFNASYMVLPRQDLAFFAVMNLNSPFPEMSLGGLADFIAHPPGHGRIDPTDYMTIDLPSELAKRVQGGELAPPAASSTASTPAQVLTSSRDWTGRYAGLRLQSYEALLPRLAVALLIGPKAVRQDAEGRLHIGAMGPYHPVAKDLYALSEPAGPLNTTIGFADLGGTLVMGPHTLQASRRLAWYERAPLTVGGVLLAPLLLMICTAVAALAAWVRRRRNPDHTASAFNSQLGLGALAFLAGIAIEMAFAVRFTRVENLGGLVALWRVAIALAMAAMAVGATLKLRQVLSMAQVFGIASRVYAGSMALLVGWLLLAAFYWGLPGPVFG